jgi:hypothetical protein
MGIVIPFYLLSITHKGVCGAEVLLCSFLTSSLDWGELHTRQLYPQKKSHRKEAGVGSSTGLVLLQEGEISYIILESNALVSSAQWTVYFFLFPWGWGEAEPTKYVGHYLAYCITLSWWMTMSDPLSLCPSQIPHDITRDRTRASAVESQRLTTWAMARPFSSVCGGTA